MFRDRRTLNGLSSANRLETTFTTAGPPRPVLRLRAGGGGGPPSQSPTPVGGFWACFRTAVMRPRDRAPRGPEVLHLLTALDTPGPKRCWAPSNRLPPGKGTSARRPLMEVLTERAVRGSRENPQDLPAQVPHTGCSRPLKQGRGEKGFCAAAGDPAARGRTRRWRSLWGKSELLVRTPWRC